MIPNNDAEATMRSEGEVLAFLAELEEQETRTSSNEKLVPPGERPCPICQKHMAVEFQHGVGIDVCEAHGIWLDRGELPGIAGQIRSGASIDRVDAVRRARREGKLSGTLFGAWSLLMD